MFDANSWLGQSYLQNDPHLQNENGKLFANFLRNNKQLTLLNGQKFCNGSSTQSRMVNGTMENSIIDFIVVCDKILPFVQLMFIDEKRIHSLGNFCQKKQDQGSQVAPQVAIDHHIIPKYPLNKIIQVLLM